MLVLSGIWGACSAGGGAKTKRALLELICRLDIHTSAQSGPARVLAGLVPREEQLESKNPDRKMDGSPHKSSRVPVLDTDQLMLGASHS